MERSASVLTALRDTEILTAERKNCSSYTCCKKKKKIVHLFMEMKKWLKMCRLFEVFIALSREMKIESSQSKGFYATFPSDFYVWNTLSQVEKPRSKKGERWRRSLTWVRGGLVVDNVWLLRNPLWEIWRNVRLDLLLCILRSKINVASPPPKEENYLRLHCPLAKVHYKQQKVKQSTNTLEETICYLLPGHMVGVHMVSGFNR